jgi:cytoskeletal protein CcmA (bactofilin family)
MWTQLTSPKHDASQAVAAGPAAAAASGRTMEERRVVAWVGKSVVFKGGLSSAEDVTLDGSVEGTIDVGDHSLTIGPDADIRADIVGKVVMIRGRVKGKIAASDTIHLYETASVEGEFKSPKFVMDDGALVVGRIETLKSSPGVKAQPAGLATA